MGRRTDARDAALHVITRHAERMPDLIPIEPRTQGMDPRDAALAHGLVDASIRRWVTLSYLLEKIGGRDVREMEPRMQAALVAGAAQLLLFDRIPDHAAISETVDWAKRRIRAGAGGMTNAILRKVVRARGEKIEAWNGQQDAIPLSDRGALTLRDVTLPGGFEQKLAVGCSLPQSLLRSWTALGADVADLALHTLVHPPTVCFVGDAVGIDDDPRFAPHDADGHAVYVGERAQLGRALDDHPGIWVQDAASSGVVRGLTPGDETVIVDLCAGRGTKTRHLLARFPRASVIACEVDEERLESLRAVFDGNGRVEVVHAGTVGDRGEGWADLVLADVPCSNSGVLPRRTEARYRVRSAAMARMIETQREILGAARAVTRDGGRLVYSTCSLEHEENQMQCAWACETLGVELERERVTLPAGLPGGTASGYMDGSYAAEMRVAG